CERMNQHAKRLSQDAILYFEANLTEMKIERADGRGLCCSKQNLTGEPAALLENAINEMIFPEDKETVRRFFNRELLLAGFAEGKTEQEIEIRILQNDQPKWVCITIEMITDPYTENILVYVLFRDIDETKTKEMNIRKQAETDGLTDLYNRTALEWQIMQVLAENMDERCAFAIIDVDDLKIVNDTLGHIQGDRAIRAFADTLRSCFDEPNLIGRIGGDEFLVFLRNVDNEQELGEIMEGLVRKLTTLRVGAKDVYPLHGSIGIVMRNSSEDDFETLYKKADTALYYVKRHGKNNYAFYSAEMKCIDDFSKGGKDISPKNTGYVE
ncbi:MAG: GGDEF domain-containing protein, partial [Clostridiales bacterium]